MTTTTNTPEPITRTQTTTRIIRRIVITWERDENTGIRNLDDQMTLGKNNRVDVQKTYEDIMEIGGCTETQSRYQTAANISRVMAWKEGSWYYVGCRVTAGYDEYDTDAFTTSGTVGYDSLFGIESFAGAEYQKEVESDLAGELYYSVKNAGYNITPEAWKALPRVQAAESCYEPIDTDPGLSESPLPILPAEDAQYTYRYGSRSDEEGNYYNVDDAEGEILATCKECDSIMLGYNKDDEAAHFPDCALFATSELIAA